MKEVIFLLLLLLLQSGSNGFNLTEKLWTTDQGNEALTSDTDLTPSPAAVHGSVDAGTTARSPHSETQAAEESVLQALISASSGKTLGKKALKKDSNAMTSILASQSKGHSDGNSDIDKIRNLQSNARKAPLLQEVTINQDTAIENRYPKQPSHSTGITNIQRDANTKPSVSEATRGKNWCAYIHTRLLPTVVVDNLETFSSGRAKPCTWLIGSCAQRSQTTTHQAYRIEHKIVTSLEWKCCPGYSGQDCQLKAEEHQSLLHSTQAESSRTVNEKAPGASQEPSGPALTQKMNENISSQEMKLTFLQKKVDNVAAAMNDLSKMLSSLEGKINEDKGTDFQSFLKGLKSRSINMLVKDIVGEQLEVFRREMLENMAQIFKTVSSLSNDLEKTRELVKHLNETQEKFSLDKDIRSTNLDILELKSHMVQMKEEITLICDKPIKALQKRQKSLENNLEHQQSRNVIYYESLNRTLNEIRDASEQLLSTEESSRQKIPSTDEVIEYNITEYMFTLHEKVKKQDLIVLQIYDDLRVQDHKISNLSLALEIQRGSVLGVCDDMLSESRKDFQMQVSGTQENVVALNRSVFDLVLSLDSKMDKMNEQINDLSYDMEILQPLIEQGPPFSLTSEYEQQIQSEAINEKLENLTAVVDGMSSTIKELSKTQEGLKNKSQAYQELLESQMNECSKEIEDGLNKTMIIINNAIDSIQDNYVQKDMLYVLKNETEVCCGRAEKLDSLLAFFSQFQQLNESIWTLPISKQKHEFTSQVTPSLPDIPHVESDKTILHNFRRINYILNETSSKVDNQQQDITHLEEKLLDSLEASKDLEVRLLVVESKISKFLEKNYVSQKKNKAALTEKEQTASLQLQTLNSRIKALEAKSIRFSNSIPLLNKTAHEAWGLCQDANSRIQKVNASIPVLIKLAQPDIPLLHRGLQELIESVLEIKAGTILTNLTQHVDMSVASAMNNATKLQKQVKPTTKKPAPVKKGAANVTLSLSSRSQRNTDNAIDSGQYSACVSSPCQNGGTCINDRQSFVCACRHPFGGVNCSMKLVNDDASSVDFSKGSYRYAPMVAFFASHTYGMTTPGPIRFNNLDVNYGASFAPATGKFHVPYLGVYVFEYTIESFSPHASGYLVVDGIDKLSFQAENISSNKYNDRVIAGNALLELNYGQEVWLRLATGSIPAKYPPVTTFSGYLLYRT
ncbi:multimerin-1 [Coturnix japonica]|uniref:Multimerin-1 n=1 Tax=Coturnix japonica TaxID=93934 RepID=A0A8C2T9L9_COTJA|nr:multimerin-1 [Coturnix japonica]